MVIPKNLKSDEIKLEQPLFYNIPYGLRFEIGPPDQEIWVDFDKGVLNNHYFDMARDRAIAIFETAFAPSDHISIAYQIRSDGRRKIRKGSFLFQQISNLQARTTTFSRRRDLYTIDLESKHDCHRRVMISELQVQDVNYQNLLNAVVNQDFSLRRQPSIRGECYFINHDKALVLNLYDDRGMDVVALHKEPLELLYQTHHKWILNYNQERIDQLFA